MDERETHVKPNFALLGKYGMMVERYYDLFDSSNLIKLCCIP